MNLRRLVLAVLLVAVAACGNPPTEPAAAPLGPSMEGNGFTLGGGRSDTTTAPAAGEPVAAEPAGNGFTLGGG